MSAEPDTAVVIVAAGDGARLAAGRPKALVHLAGPTILERALHGVLSLVRPVQIIVMAPPAAIVETREAVARAAGTAAEWVVVLPGGASRTASVRAGLAALSPSVTTVLVHDAARPLTPVSLFEGVIGAVESTGDAVVPALPVVDTVKEVARDGVVLGTVDRDGLRAVQTPQGFPRGLLERAYADESAEHTDDAATVAAIGGTVRTVPGDERAFKITTSWDLRRAELLIGRGDVRTGIGVDVHAVGGEGALRLAGLEWPGEPALSGHSDGDAVAHAVVDALLGAAGLGDIGTMFGTDDPALSGAAGGVFLRGAVEALARAGFEPVNVSVQLVGNRPRFSGRRAEAERAMSDLVGAPVTIAATTTDGLGFTGRGEGVMAIASALVRSQGGGVLE